MLSEQAGDSRYAKNARAMFNLSYHIVWCPKYRRKVLVGDVAQRLKHILLATAQQYGVLIETMACPTTFICLCHQTQLDAKVSPQGTSQRCPCGASVPKKLSGREHHCTKCGLQSTGDHVSAMEILKARTEPSCTNET
jgi:Transposase IS200 like/Putative transposase DNA-binding domain